jgi:hypothetical protein
MTKGAEVGAWQAQARATYRAGACTMREGDATCTVHRAKHAQGSPGVLSNEVLPLESMSKEQRSVRAWECVRVAIVCGSPGVLSCKTVIPMWGRVIGYHGCRGSE